MKAVHFGAGNIGRGFIGLLLSQSGYEVVFVTRNRDKIERLQRDQQYDVQLANETSDCLTVRGVTAVSTNDHESVREHIATSDLVTTAVGVDVLEHIAKPIADGISLRYARGIQDTLQVIACENGIRVSSNLATLVDEYLDDPVRVYAKHAVVFPDTVVDRIVPAQNHADPLTVTVEPYYEWVIEESGLPSDAPRVHGATYVETLEPYVERKLYTVNTGHCSAAYLGYLEGHETIQEALKSPTLREKVRSVLQETGRLLIHKHQLDAVAHQRYIQKILKRFTNPHLTDSVTRVGRSPIRKLGADERLVRPALQVHATGGDPDHLTSVIAAAMLFRHEADGQVGKLQTAIQQMGLHDTITKYMGIAKHHPVHGKIVRTYQQLRSRHEQRSTQPHPGKADPSVTAG